MKAVLLENTDTSRVRVDAALQEARSRLAAVSDEALRAQLAEDLERLYAQRIEIVEAAEARAVAAQLARLQRERAVAESAAHRERVARLEVQTRESLLNDGRVLVLSNAADQPVDFTLFCSTADNVYSKSFFLVIPARGRREVGVLEGWLGRNFAPTDRCEARLLGETVWAKTVA